MFPIHKWRSFCSWIHNAANQRCSQDFVLRGPENRGAVGAEFDERGGDWGWGNGYPLPSRLAGLGERRSKMLDSSENIK